MTNNTMNYQHNQQHDEPITQPTTQQTSNTTNNNTSLYKVIIVWCTMVSPCSTSFTHVQSESVGSQGEAFSRFLIWIPILKILIA
jgi:hypothetical protein